jgi:hypothetical protein
MGSSNELQRVPTLIPINKFMCYKLLPTAIGYRTIQREEFSAIRYKSPRSLAVHGLYFP